jgi:SAM-dependent methyltransferase
MIFLKILIKVPLVLGENLLFSVFPSLRPFVEKYFYNPLDFKSNHVSYSQKKFKEFCQYTDGYSLQGKTLLELGPGGSLGFGLLCLEQELSKYVAIDDGLHAFISPSQLTYYKQLLSRKSSSVTTYFTKTLEGWQPRPEKISSLAINQTATYPLPDTSVDIIYSCAVLEHVHDLDLCFAEMNRVLKPGGIMYHEVDLRDHIFSQKSLWFLTIPEFWFRALFSKTGAYVNRKRFSYYTHLAKKFDLLVEHTEATTTYTGAHFPRKLSSLSAQDRTTLTFIMVLKKE